MKLWGAKRLWALSGVLLVAVTASVWALNYYVWAVNATGLTLAIVSDDTSTAVSDTSTTNGIVPVTGGQITYRWGWANVPGGGNVTFTQTLPVGVTWNAASIAAGCSVSGTYLTTGETLTCTISNLTDIPGTTDKTATVKNMNGGAAITSKLVSGSQQSGNVTLTTASTSQVQMQVARGSSNYMTDAKDPATGTISGLQLPFSMAIYVPGTTADQIKGQESLGSSSGFSYTVTIPSGAQLISCGTASTYQNDSSYSTMPTFGTGSSTATNRAANSGSMTCSQNGTTLTVTFSGVDARLNTIPTASAGYYPTKGIFALGGVYLWMPSTAFNSSTSTNVTVTANAANFTSASGIGSTTTAVSTSYPIQLPAFALNQTGVSFGTGTPYPGTNNNQNTQFYVPSGSGQSATGVQLCQVWDPGLQRIRDTTQPSYSGVNITGLQASNFTIEYGTNSYADDAARRNADCGSVGDGAANWFSSIAAAGGVSEVSAVRIRYNRSLDPGQYLTMSVAVTTPTSLSIAPNVSNPSGSQTIAFFNNRKSDQTAVQRLASGSSASTTLSTASVRNTVYFPASDVKPGATTNVTLTPTVTTGNASVVDGRSAVGVTETVTLPNGCFTFVPGTPAPISVTPSAPASPVTGQNCTTVSGQVVVWNLGNVPTSTGASPISFALNVNPATPTPVISTISAVIASNSDKVGSSSRTSTNTINVNTVNQFQISLTASSANVNTGIPFTYRAGWKNASSSDMQNGGYVVDVLPFVGDGRGTAGLGGLTLNSVTTNPSGQPVQYTTDTAASVQSALSGDTSGNTGINWTSTLPGSGVTAVRVRTQTLTAGAAGYMDISVTPTGFIKGGTMANDLTAKADDLTSGFSGTEDLSLQSSSSTVAGNVYQDIDYSGTKNTGDTAINGKTVTLSGFNFGPNGINDTGSSSTILGDDIAVNTTTTTDANGDFNFTVSPGVYTASVDSTNVVNGNTSNLITSPASKFEVSGAATVTGKNFGYQEPISPPVATDDNASTNSNLTIYQGASVTFNELANDTTYVPAGVPATTIGSPTSPDRGTAILNADKTITYTANSVWPGSITGLTYVATFQYTLTNPQGSSTATVTVTVKRLPFGTADVASIKDRQTIDVDALANDYGDTIGFDSSVPPTTNGSGSVSVVNNKIRFVSAVHAWGVSETSYTEAVTYHIKDAANNTATGVVTFTIYRAPVVANDTKTIAYNSPTTIDVLANDLVGKSPATLSIVSQPGNGVASVSGSNILFTPGSTQTGTVSFVYAVTDGLGQVTNGTATVTVANQFVAQNDGSNGSPIRVPQTGKTIDVLANDSGSSLSISGVGTPTNGTASISNGKIQYIPTAGFSGTDSFTYTAKDVLNTTQVVTVFVKVIAAPVTAADTGWTNTATTKDFDVLGNDSYDTSSVLTITGSTGTGTASVVNNKIHFVPGTAGTQTITYRILDDVGQSATGTLTITVVNVFAVADEGTASTPIRIPQTGKTVDVLLNDTGSDLTITAVGMPGHGTATISNGKIQYLPLNGFSGTDSFTYTAKDAVNATQTGTVYLTIVAAPVTAADTGWTNTATTKDFDVLGNDTYDPSSTVTIITAPGSGTATVQGSKIHYVPSGTGTTSLTYRVTDDLGQNASGTLTITTVLPFTTSDDGSATSPLQAPAAGKTIDVLSNDTGSALTIVAVGTPAHGSVVISNNKLVYVPTNGYGGADSFTYNVIDQVGVNKMATVYMYAMAVPALTADTVTTDSDTTVVSDVRSNDVADISAALAITTQPAKGVASIVNGNIRYIPAQNYDGTVVIGYSLTDALGQSSSSTLTVVVTAAFAARDDGSTTYPLETYPEGIVISPLLNDSGLSPSLISVTQPSHGTATVKNDTVTYLPADGYTGSDTFTYTMTDSHGQIAVGNVTILVKSHPLLPVQSSPSGIPSQVTRPRAETVDSAPASQSAGGSVANVTPGPAIAPVTTGNSILLNDYQEYFDAGKKLSLSPNQVVHFNIIRADNTAEHHTVSISSVGDGYADIIVRSDPIHDRLSVGQSKYYDVDKNSIDDIIVTLRSIKDGKADFTFRQLGEAAAASGPTHSFNWWWLIIIFIVIVVLTIRFVARLRTKKS